MRVRLSELEKEQLFMKQGMMDKTGNGKTFLTSISKGIVKIVILSGQAGGCEAKALNEVKWEERDRLFTKEVRFTEGFTHKTV